MALVCIAPPMVEPVSLIELKDMLRIDQGDNSQDSVLNGLNYAARLHTENLTERRIVQQTWQLSADFFPGYIDLKMAGQKFSSPFVSGANAVLVGIRYALVMPFPPMQSLASFTYQNANGLVTSMITGPLTISSVGNVLGQQIGVTTSVPHGLQSQSGVLISGNSALLALLGAQASQVITVTGASTLVFNGSVGTGATIASGGNLTGFNFVLDTLSQPARLTPIFGQMWPVARVVANAVQISFVCGYAVPVSLTATASTAVLTGATFTPANVGQFISIPGAGYGGGCLDTIIQSVDGGGNGSLRDLPLTTASNTTALLVSYGNPTHFHAFKLGIKFLVNHWFVNRIGGNMDDVKKVVRSIVGPALDLRL